MRRAASTTLHAGWWGSSVNGRPNEPLAGSSLAGFGHRVPEGAVELGRAVCPTSTVSMERSAPA